MTTLPVFLGYLTSPHRPHRIRGGDCLRAKLLRAVGRGAGAVAGRHPQRVVPAAVVAHRAAGADEGAQEDPLRRVRRRQGGN